MKDPTSCFSTTSCQRDSPQNGSRLARDAWQLLLLLLCSPGLVKFHGPLLGLQAAMANMASHYLPVCLLGLCILGCNSLQLGAGLILILAWKLCVEVLLPVQQALRQPLTIAWAWSLQLLSTLIHGACRGILQLLRHLRWGAHLALLTVVQWACYRLVNLPHENSKALELLLWAVLQQVAVSLLVRCLDRVWEAMGQVAQAMQGRGFNPWSGPGYAGAASKDLDVVTTILPATTVPFSQRFPGPDPSTLSRLTSASISLCLKVGDKDTSKEKGGCSFGTTNVPINTRLQRNRASKMPFRSSSKQALAQQVKATCVLIFLLYIYAVSLFVQILK